MKRNMLLMILILISIKQLTAQTNYVLSFDGNNDYISIPDNPGFVVNKVTIEMWIYWDNVSVPNDVDFLIGKNTEELEIHTGGGSGNHGLRFIPTSKVYLDTQTDVFLSSQWYHVAFIYAPNPDSTLSICKCYINGIEKALRNDGNYHISTAITQSVEPLKIGIRKGLVMPFQGRIDEVRLWNIVRTQQQIQDNMNLELSGSEPGLILYYKMNEGSGTIITDISSSHINGTLVNGTSWLLSDNPLPVELTSFTATAIDKGVELKWQTATEVNNYGFEIERFTPALGKEGAGGGWTPLCFVPGAGNSNSPKEYSYIDANPIQGNTEYRLKQIDLDGKFKYYSNTAKINLLTDVKEKQIPKEFALSQNYPNPFNPSTNIEFAIANSGFVSLKVYDVLGNEVATLVNEIKQAGYYSVNFNASNLSTGVYIYRLTAGKFISTKKLMLMK